MKKIQLVFCLLITTFSFSQTNYGNQVKKKEVEKGLVTFSNTSDNKGNVVIGFRMNDLPVGAQMLIDASGTKTYSNYNKDHQMDGTTIIMNTTTGEMTLYTYRDNELNGPAFKITNGNVAWTKQYKKGKEDLKGYTVNHSADFYTDKNTPSFEGFTIEKYNGSYALGYFAYGRRAFPIIHIWNDGDSYYGQCIQGERKEFGVYIYENGSKYVGAWSKNSKEGLGFMMDANGEVTNKGYFDNNELKIKL